MRTIAFVIFILFVIFPIFNTIPAFGTEISIVSADYTGPNEITIVFDGPVDWGIEDFTGISHNLTAGSPNVSSIAETSPSSTVRITFDGSAVFPDETGTIEIAAISDVSETNWLTANEKVLSDGQAPTMDFLVIVSATTINVIFGEDLDDSTISAGDFTVTNAAEESLTVTSASETSSGVVTLTLDEPVSGTVTVTLVGPISDAISSSNVLSFGSLDVTIIPEGVPVDIAVEAGGTGTFSYSETEEKKTGYISLGVTLPVGQQGTITVVTEIESLLEFGINFVTGADITAPCTGLCTIQFTVPNSLLVGTGLNTESISIYHDSNENKLIEADEAIATTIDTTTIPGSTIFTANISSNSDVIVASFCSKTGSCGFVDPPTQEIPSWIKNNAGWWADGQIDDVAFVQGIQYLIDQGIMNIPQTESGESSGNDIPSWIKNNAGWWADGSIDDNSFVQGIQYLITNGILTP